MIPYPLRTPELPGIGGRIGPDPEDFAVAEIPLYPLSGEGQHCFVRIRKRELTTFTAIEALADALGLSPRDVGYAGMKDKRAVTEQWVSLPDVDPERVRSLRLAGLEVLEAVRHRNKLRTGHLAGNRFSITVVGAAPAAAGPANAILARLAEVGAYHLFGPQRFGHVERTAHDGLALLCGEADHPARRARGRHRRLLVSAAQSVLFNRYLARRLSLGPAEDPLVGEICLADVPSGPLFGPKMRRPPAGSALHALEDEVLTEAGLSWDALERWRKLAPGGRRPLLVRPTEVSVDLTGEDRLRVRFTLPAGAYATLILREVIKPVDWPGGLRRD